MMYCNYLQIYYSTNKYFNINNKKFRALYAPPSSSSRGLGDLPALLDAFGPLFRSRKFQTKQAQFSVKIGPSNMFRGDRPQQFMRKSLSSKAHGITVGSTGSAGIYTQGSISPS